MDILAIKCTNTTSNFGQIESPDQPFPVTFSKKENSVNVQKEAFLENRESVFEKNANPL